VANFETNQYGDIVLPVAVHDSNVYGLLIAGAENRVTLFLDCEGPAPSAFAEVVFEGVLAHSFENINPGNIAFDLRPVDPQEFMNQHGALLESRSRSHGWPEQFASAEQFERLIVDGGYGVLELNQSVGMSGWIIAKTVTGIPRAERRRF